MRHIVFLLLFSLLLTGCASAQPELNTENTDALSVIEEQTVESTAFATQEPFDPIQRLLEVMSVEEKVGQLFLARCPGASALEDLLSYHLGGYLLFSQDFEGQTQESLRQIILEYQSNVPIPILIAVDEEGGSVCRVSTNPSFRSSRFPSPREAYADGGMEQVLAVESEKAVLLRDLGINLNMGPVCDISTGFGAFMYSRSLGEDADITSRFVSSTVKILQNQGVGSVMKHFPGYGNNADTHTGIVQDERTLEELEGTDLKPFAAGIDAGCGAVLVSHTIVTAMDETMPASLSPDVHEYLRQNMGFDGVIITDDLVMQAITDAYGAEEAAILAVLAGNDLLCSTQYQIQYAAVLDAVESGRIPMEQLDRSVLRILQWKKDLGLLFS